MKPGDVLTCSTCGARSLPLHTTGGRRWEEGGALVATWPDRTLAAGRHEVVVEAWAGRGAHCLGCYYDALDGRAPAAPGSGLEIPAPPPMTATEARAGEAELRARAAAALGPALERLEEQLVEPVVKKVQLALF